MGCPKIIARLVEDAPSQIQRTITGLPFKIRNRREYFTFHAGNFISTGATVGDKKD
jgi:hypothetical protein